MNRASVVLAKPDRTSCPASALSAGITTSSILIGSMPGLIRLLDPLIIDPTGQLGMVAEIGIG
jgi:hypothetical protein